MHCHHPSLANLLLTTGTVYGAISRKAQRRGVSCTEFDIDDFIDRKLFPHITDHNHCLHHLLPPTAASEKDNMVISYLTLNIISIKQFHQSLSL